MAHGNEKVFAEHIEIIFGGLIEFLKKIENQNVRIIKDWVDIPDEIGLTCLSNLVAIVVYFKFFKVFL